MLFEIDVLFEGSFLTAFMISSLDIRLKEKFSLTHTMFLSTYSFLHFQNIETCLLLAASGPLMHL